MAGLLLNHWYVAAWSKDVATSPVARMICNIPLVFFRKSDGTVAALRDRCPHRFAPLSMGHVDGDLIACPYHGLKFNGAGACVHNPFGEPPAHAIVESFPVVERDEMVWVWTGDPAQATTDAVPDYSGYVLPGQDCIRQHFMLDGHIMLGVENLLDLTHATALHATSFASGPYNNFLEAEHRAYFEGDELFACWDMHFDGGTNYARTTWIAPGRMTISSTYDDKGRRLDPPWYQHHIYTPETETRTHYFTAERFDPTLESPQHMEERMRQFKELVFDREDNPVVAAIQKEMGEQDFFDMKPALLVTDKACVLARRRYDKMLREERGESA
jgi:vanillate O-demethylase monooxygenase subunit